MQPQASSFVPSFVPSFIPSSAIRRRLGLGLTALALFGTPACDAPGEEDLEMFADSEGDELTSSTPGSEAHLIADDTIEAGPDDDILVGGNGADTISGDDDDDIMFADTITADVDDKTDSLVGGAGTDRVFPGDGETRAWTFISQAESSTWQVGSTYITFDADGVIEDDNLFEIEVTTGW